MQIWYIIFLFLFLFLFSICTCFPGAFKGNKSSMKIFNPPYRFIVSLDLARNKCTNNDTNDKTIPANATHFILDLIS